MGDGQNQIKPLVVPLLPSLERGKKAEEKDLPKTDDESSSKHRKANAAQVFDKKWHAAQAAERRNNLSALITRGENHAPPERAKSNVPQQFERKQVEQLPEQTKNAVDTAHQLKQTRNTVAYYNRDGQNQLEQTKNSANVQRNIEQAKNLVDKSLDDLISLARQHKDFKSFQAEPKKFWDDVKKMSHLSVVEKYVNGKLEPRAVSRYGDLLEILNRQLPGNKSSNSNHLHGFLSTLPKSERNVFLARHQINQTFGANELFAGRGVTPDKNGRFPLQNLLSANGKNPEISANVILSLIGGEALGEAATLLLEQSNLFPNAQFLFNPKTAALLGLTLALQQNINALLSLETLAPEAHLPETLNETAAPRLFNTENASDTPETINAAASKSANETLASGALINGALATIEQYAKVKRQALDLRTDLNGGDGFRFSAGATGAMMGATVGCVVPLAEKGISEILGFASSVVVGLTDSGLRSLGANALVSVITSGVQTFLNVSSNRNNLPDDAANTFLNAAQEFIENDLRDNLFSPRADTLLPA